MDSIFARDEIAVESTVTSHFSTIGIPLSQCWQRDFCVCGTIGKEDPMIVLISLV
jgi:hypothetical protein